MKTIINNYQFVEHAKYFAMGAHMGAGQKRKYDGQDYIVHPAEVADILKKFATNPVSDEMIAAAWCHDVVEDTKVTLEQVREAFGDKTAELVEALTDVSTPADGNRKVRKQMDLEHTANSPVDAKSIKCADLISNTKSIVQYDPDFARVYLYEKARLLNVMSDADPGLLAECWGTLRKAKEHLKSLDSQAKT